MREFQVCKGSGQELQQRAEIVGLERRKQAAAAVADKRHARIAQRKLVLGQMRARAHQYEHVGPVGRALPAIVRHAQMCNPVRDFIGDHAALAITRVVVAFGARRRQHVAQPGSSFPRLLPLALSERQQHEGARLRCACALRLVQRVVTGQRAIEGRDHGP
jgi:hypothetical protein